MKPYGIGLVIILIAFVMGTYTAYVSYNFLANPPTASETAARLDELKTATVLGIISQVIAILGILVFIVEFMKHEHGITSKAVSPATS
jgi:hypothetical protein